MATKLITIYWRDIPSRVIARAGRRNFKFPLPRRFQVAIERAAMRAGKGRSACYLEAWRRHSEPCSGGEARARTEALALVVRLEESFGDERLEALVKSGGHGL